MYIYSKFINLLKYILVLLHTETATCTMQKIEQNLKIFEGLIILQVKSIGFISKTSFQY